MIDLFRKKSLMSDNIHVIKNTGYYFIMSGVIFLVGGIIQGMILLLFENNDADLMGLIELFSCAAVVLATLFVAYRMKRSLKSLGLVRQHFFSHYLLGHFIGFITLSGALFITLCLGGAVFKGFVLENQFLWLLYFLAFMVQGFEEELLCRGFMMVGLSKKMSMFSSMMVNSLYFAALHLANPGISILALVNLFLAGFAFSVMALYFDDLWVASGAHSMWNFAQGNVYGILVSGMSMGPSLFRFDLQGSNLISGGNFGLEGGIGVFVIELVTILVFALAYKWKEGKKHETDLQGEI